MKNTEIINKFFNAYGSGDMDGIKEAAAEDMKWSFPGSNPLSGIKSGIGDVIAFFDEMGSAMGKSMVHVDKLVMGENDSYVLEGQHIRTSREDGINIDQEMCVLWTFENGKIKEGRHFTANQEEADRFFDNVLQEQHP